MGPCVLTLTFATLLLLSPVPSHSSAPTEDNAGPGALEAPIADLYDPDLYGAREAAVKLALFGPEAKEAVPALLVLLESTEKATHTAEPSALPPLHP
jgi:hypothetical protein